MNIFLNLPKEILALIIKFINDKSKISELIAILPLRELALEERFSTYHVTTRCNHGDGCSEILKSLYHQFKFKPSKIIGETSAIHVLLNFGKSGSLATISNCYHEDISDAVDYSMCKFEILLRCCNHFFELKRIMNHVNVVGIDLYGLFSCPSDIDKSAHSYLNAIKSASLETLRTPYKISFMVEFPTSLKHMALRLRENEAINLDLRTLVNLEHFECQGLFGMKSIMDLNISTSIKGLKIYSSGFEELGDLRSLNKLKTLQISGCKELIDFIKCCFPDSLDYVEYEHRVSASKVTELYESTKIGMVEQFDISDFSNDGTSYCMHSNTNFPTNLNTLCISDHAGTLQLGSNLKLKHIGILKLGNISKLDLNALLASLPKVMFSLSICTSNISSFEGKALFPDLNELQLECNKFENIFRTNLHELKILSILNLKHNVSVQPEKYIRFDPFQMLSIDDSISSIIEASEEIETKFNKQSDTVNVKMQKMMNLSLIQASQKDPILSNGTRPYIIDPIVSQVSFIGCENLKFLTIIGLDIKVLNINYFPSTLENLTIEELELQSIKGNFENLIHLKNLTLKENQINDLMLLNQTFPISLKTLNLSKNIINDLNCLKLDNCVNLADLILNEVATQDQPKGANELKELFFRLAPAKGTHFVLTTTNSQTIFEFYDGIDYSGGPQ